MFYDANRISGLGSINVEPDARFCHEHAAMQAVIESQQNELIMFENNLAVDFQEAAMIHEGAYAEDIEALHENVFTDIFKRIKDLFMKLWAKIKSIFKVFIAKFDSIFMKSSKDFIKKYKKDVLKKDLKDITINYSAPNRVDFVISSALQVSLTDQEFLSNVNDPSNIKRALEDYDSEEQEQVYIRHLTGLQNVTLSDFDKEYHEHCYEDESKEDLTGSLLSDAIATLEGSDDVLKRVKKANDILNKAVDKIIKEIDKTQSEFAKKKSNEGVSIYTTYSTAAGEKNVSSSNIKSALGSDNAEQNRNSKEWVQTALSLLSKRATCLQSCVTKVTAGTIREAKFGASQARRVIVKALGAKSVTGESALLDAIEESAAYEAEIELR